MFFAVKKYHAYVCQCLKRQRFRGFLTSEVMGAANCLLGPQSKLLRFRLLIIGVLIVALFPKLAFCEHRGAGDWGFEYGYVGDDQMRYAVTKELSHRGEPLILIGCAERKQVSQSRTTLETIYFVDSPEEGFWQGEPLTNSGTRLGWIRFSSAEEAEPLLVSPGQDGYYFGLEVHFATHALERESSVHICPAKDTALSRCRNFSLRGIREAVKYVCNRDL
jgi:hypothetical protein